MIRTILTTMILVTAGGSAALAGSITLQDSTGSTAGGEYLATVVTPFEDHPAGMTFTTFCLERNEYMVEGVEYQAELAESALEGGLGGPTPDPLDPMTAFLYYGMRKGSLVDGAGHLYASGDSAQDVTDANDLQRAIWYIEQEYRRTTWSETGDFKDFDPGYNRYTSLAHDAVHGTAPSWSGIGDVRVLRLTNPDGSYAQDQLALVHMPLPTAAWPALGMLLVLALRRRAIRKRAA